jgi:hypothetical protein
LFTKQFYSLGLLNSGLATVHLKAIYPPKLHGDIEFSARAVTLFPVRVVDFSKPAAKSRHEAGCLGREPERRFQLMNILKAESPVAELAHTLEVTSSGFHARTDQLTVRAASKFVI